MLRSSVFAGDDPTPWKLLYRASVDRVERTGPDEVTLWLKRSVVREAFADPGMLFRIRLAGCTRFEHWLDGMGMAETATTDLATISLRRAVILDATYFYERLRISCVHGALLARYVSLTIELDSYSPHEATRRAIDVTELRAAVAPLWASWREDVRFVHPAIRAGELSGMLTAWRTERTRVLADAIEIIGGPVLVELAAAIDAVDWNETWTYDDAALAARGVPWVGFTRELAAVRSQAPDPRISRAVIAMFEARGGSMYWFRPDQVAHVVPQAATNNEPSFADHALALIEHHADDGTPALLEERADALAYEADCNDAEMSQRVWELAVVLRARYPNDLGEIAALRIASWFTSGTKS